MKTLMIFLLSFICLLTSAQIISLTGVSGNFGLNQSQYLPNLVKQYRIDVGSNARVNISGSYDLGAGDVIMIVECNDYFMTISSDLREFITSGSGTFNYTTTITNGKLLIFFLSDGIDSGADGHSGFSFDYAQNLDAVNHFPEIGPVEIGSTSLNGPLLSINDPSRSATRPQDIEDSYILLTSGSLITQQLGIDANQIKTDGRLTIESDGQFVLGSEGKMYINAKSGINLNLQEGNFYFNSSQADKGKVGIGVTSAEATLHVGGDILADEIRVEDIAAANMNLSGNIAANNITVKANGNTADFVFEDDYDLKDLSEVESFIKTHGHLPLIPSAKEMEEQGVNLAEMNKLLLQTVEEMTLHLIEKDKEVESLEEELSSINKEIQTIKELILSKDLINQ